MNPAFSKTFIIDYYFEVVQKLKFGIYDIDNKTISLSDDDFLGECECTLGQVSIQLQYCVVSILTKELGVFDKCSLVYFLKLKTFNHFKDQIHIFMWLA